jgi:hypothetical protein
MVSRQFLTRGTTLVVSLMFLTLLLPAAPPATAQNNCHTFAETGYPVCGPFLEYWRNNGGLRQQGLPISVPQSEVSPTDGRTYDVQYFERSVFEYHPEEPSGVLLSLLGNFIYRERYAGNAPNQSANNSPGSISFPLTGKRLGGRFLAYWQQNGGLRQQGYPISNEFIERSELDGKEYRVQYFERAVFEYHPENPVPNDVLLSQLGTFRYSKVHPRGSNITPPQSQVLIPTGVAPTPTPAAGPPPGTSLPPDVPRGPGIIGTWDCTSHYTDKNGARGCDALLYISGRNYEIWKPSNRTRLGGGTVQFTGSRATFTGFLSVYGTALLTDTEELTFSAYSPDLGNIVLIYVRRF